MKISNLYKQLLSEGHDINHHLKKFNLMLKKANVQGHLSFNWWPINKLKTTPTSTIDTDAYRELGLDIIQNGMVPILVDKEGGYVMDGNHRVEILKRMRIKLVPVFELTGEWFREDDDLLNFLDEYNTNTPLIQIQK